MNGRCIKHLPSDSEMNFVLLWNMDKLADSYKLIMQVCQKYGLQLFTKICVTLNIATSWSISKESDYSKDRLSFRYYLLKHFFSFFCFYNQCWNIFLPDGIYNIYLNYFFIKETVFIDKRELFISCPFFIIYFWILSNV